MTIVFEKRSVKDEDNAKQRPISGVEAGEENNENGEADLETAAGTNVLRPLFVYRQQLAHRQRIRKSGRRDVRNF